MDLSTPQTVAQAVQAATAAAAQVSQSPPPPLQQSQAPIAQSSAIDNLTCQWQGCGERCDSAESLYDHVCERHVGRKSTNNLNLTCAWGPCRTTTVKRDHITSHIRVHVPLKPHKCDFCGKAFKRPQDLKKHVKTHADDSVLMSSPQQPAPGRSAMGGVQMGQQHGKAFPPAAAYYGGHDNSLVNPYPTYQPMANGSNGAGYPHPNNGQYAGYGSVSYPNSSGAMQDLQSMDTRRRIIEALNDFLGDIKRRAIDPAAYYDVGQRLQANTLPLPTGTGYNTGYNTSTGYSGYGNTANLLESFTNAPTSNGGNHTASGGMQGPMASHAYSLPVSNARTKDDLHDIDRFLEQLQATVYETSNSNHVAASGVAHSGLHNTFAGDFGNFGGHMGNTHNRDSHSPSSIGDSSMAGASVAGGLSNLAVTQPSGGTPALTPASVSSYDSASHSPLSSHGRSSIGNMYPNLSNVPSTSNMGPEYPSTTSAPASSLAYGMDGMDARRYSGSRLQRQRNAEPDDTEMLDVSSLDEGASTPKAEHRKDSNNGDTIDPALRDADEPTPSDRSRSTPALRSDGSGVDEQWVENIRIIEALRRWVLERLKTGDYEDGSASSVAAAVAAAAAAQQADDADDEDARQAAAIAKLAEETMADVDHDEVKYPSLPTA